MKARITALFAVVVVALSLVAAASADVERPAAHQNAAAGSIKPSDMRSWDAKMWALRSREIKQWDLRSWEIRGWDVRPWDLKAWASWGSGASKVRPRDAYSVKGW